VQSIELRLPVKQ